jgi:hypothetical protein
MAVSLYNLCLSLGMVSFFNIHNILEILLIVVLNTYNDNPICSAVKFDGYIDLLLE